MLRLEGKRVYLACGSHDMRKSINGLAMIVESSLRLDPSIRLEFTQLEYFQVFKIILSKSR